MINFFMGGGGGALKKNIRIGSCLGQNLNILLVFSLRLPYAVYSTFSVPRIYDAFDVTIQQLLLSALLELGL